MTDAVLITIYAALAVVVVGITVSFMVHRMHQELSTTYYWMAGCTLDWLIVTVAFHINENPNLVEYINNLAFPFIAFLPVILLRFMLYFYRGKAYARRKGYLIFYLIPAITTIISVVPSLNWLLRSDYKVIQINPIHVVSYTWNVWFYVHAAYCYVMFIISCVVVLRQYKRRSREYRLPSILLVVGMGVAYLSDLIAAGTPDSVIDNTLIGICLSMVALYFAVVNNPAVAFLATARKALYNNMDLPVFIMNRQEYILDLNQAAYEMMESLGARPGEMRAMVFGDVSSIIVGFGGTVKEGFSKDGLPHIFLPKDGEIVVYKQIRRQLSDKKGKPLGSYVVMIDITGLRQTVDELQYRAEVDVLTGIPNRRAFEEKVAELDKPENLPLSFIVGDVNRLKQVNDERGHKYGDMLLKAVAGVLAQACPAGGIAARVGGDEFIMVVPHCTADEARMVEDGIHARLKCMEKRLMGASIALGSVTKTRAEQDVGELVQEADQLMYAQKRFDRRGRVANGK